MLFWGQFWYIDSLIHRHGQIDFCLTDDWDRLFSRMFDFSRGLTIDIGARA